MTLAASHLLAGPAAKLSRFVRPSHGPGEGLTNLLSLAAGPASKCDAASVIVLVSADARRRVCALQDLPQLRRVPLSRFEGGEKLAYEMRLSARSDFVNLSDL